MKKLLSYLLFILSFQATCAQTESLSCENKRYEIDPEVITVKPKYLNSKAMEELSIIRSNILGFYDIAVPNNIDVRDYVSALKESGNFETVDFNFIAHLDNAVDSILLYSSNSYIETLRLPSRNSYSITPNDSNFNQQVLLPLINVPQAWNLSKGNPSVNVAIIDTGIDTTHVDLGIGNDGYSNVSSTLGINNDVILNEHGTIAAGVIGAKTNNGIGIAGIAGGNNGHGVTLVPYFVSHFFWI